MSTSEVLLHGGLAGTADRHPAPLALRMGMRERTLPDEWAPALTSPEGGT